MARARVLMVYTGGTIGMLPKDPKSPISPLVPANWETLKGFASTLSDLPIDVDLHEMTLIDSSDMHPDYWIEIAAAIRDRYDHYDGFVVLHGTDTMTYTATALSFLLENLAKPVVMTGSQLPLGKPRSDALQNLVTALTIAAPEPFGLPLVPEVVIYFNGLLLRGNRSRKVSSSAYAGFDSPNYPHLGEIGEHIRINRRLRRDASKEGFFINENLEKNVLMFDVVPGLRPEILRRVFASDMGLKGVVLRTFGAGNAPTNPEFVAEIENALRAGLTIVNVTQCNQGMVEMGLYDASAQLLRAGVISGTDMTPEAALIKLQFLLGLGYDAQTVKEQMQLDLRGEQSVNAFQFLYSRGHTDSGVFAAAAQPYPAKLEKESIVTANLRLDGVRLGGTESGGVLVGAFLNYPAAKEAQQRSAAEALEIPQCLGVAQGTYLGEPVNVIVECTERLKRVLSQGRPLQITLVVLGGGDASWDAASLSVYTAVGA